MSDLPECSEMLWLSEGSLSQMENCVIYQFSRPKIDSKTSFYTEISAVTNWLAIYLIDYREYIFTFLVPYSQLIH